MIPPRWVRRDRTQRIDVGRRARAGVWKGMLAGAGGVAVMTAVEKSDLAFKTLLAIRSKLMEAYEEIKNIPI